MSEQTNVFRPVYKELSVDQKELINEIKDKAQELYSLMESAIQENPSPRGRYIALGKTALEESVMWAVKGLTK